MTKVDVIFHILGISSIIDQIIIFYQKHFSKDKLYYRVLAMDLLNEIKSIFEVIFIVDYIAYILFKLFFE